MKKTFLFISLIPLLYISSCASSSKSTDQTEEEKSAVNVAVTQTGDGIGDATFQPLTDLNLRRETIPQILQDLSTPYEAVGIGCDTIMYEVIQLDNILGPDTDSTLEVEEETLSEEAGEEVADFALDTVRGFTTDAIPFRSLVRRATGAKKYDKKVRRAYEMGLKRRAYLKGIGHERHCLPPAAPYLYEKQIDKSPIEYRKAEPD
ncbi:hypothetical protein [Hirschia baltica]|uniref:Lipoprotein n=1 Tax=Hirschia baltica (strain ATCC 49814 / DSM 5838 / IFAM 1418) TaxID=582402 RepID=C6XJ19_HIRBI|nr:hypothetical protein [Hirschia baltica]ACT59114.1 conserved hypothetical protein [Hirschia baltica ATCC 49814]